MKDHSLVRKSYKLRIYPNASQSAMLAECFGISRWAYNAGLDAIGFAYRTQGQQFSTMDVNRAITELKREPEYNWLSACPRSCITESLRHLNRAFNGYFRKKSGYPKYKKKLHSQSATFQLQQHIEHSLHGRRVRFPKLGEFRIKLDKVPDGTFKMATISRHSSGKYFVSVSIEQKIAHLPKTGRSCGVDVGLHDIATTQDWKSGAPRYGERYARDLKIAQRRLSRKQSGSKRWHHARMKVARIHEKIANNRKDFTHKASSHIVKNHDCIGIETMNFSGIIKNKKLTRSMQDAGLSEFHRQLKYKAEWYGRDLRQCSRWEPTSKTCSACGIINNELTLSDREWTCECGSTHDRDKNAARNILRAAFGGSVEVTGVERELVGGCDVAA